MQLRYCCLELIICYNFDLKLMTRTFGQAPELFTTTPALVIPKAISNSGLEQSYINYYEINEAFSVRFMLYFYLFIILITF